MPFTKLRLVFVSTLLVFMGGCQGLAQQESLVGLEQELNDLNSQITAQVDTQQALLDNVVLDNQTRHDVLVDNLKQLEKTMRQVCRPAPVLATTACDDSQTVVMHQDRMVVGQVENVLVQPPGFVVEAKIDTGAQSSSIHAEQMTEFERDGKDWVRFHVIAENLDETLELPVEKYVRVIQQSDKEGTRRPVVRLRVVIGSIRESFEFTLADRSHLDQPMILGKNFLTDLAVVDVGQEFVQPLPKAK